MRWFEDNLGEYFKRIDLSYDLNKVASEIRKEFIDWMDDLSRLNDSSFKWWCRNLSSRNIYVSKIFLFICYIEAIVRLCAKFESKPGLIVVESSHLAKLLYKTLMSGMISCRIIQDPFRIMSDRIIRSFEILSHWLYSGLILFIRYIASKFTYDHRKQIPLSPVIIDSFVFDSYFTRDGKFTDRFFPHLHEYFRNRGIEVVVHPILVDIGLNSFSVYNKMRKCNTKFLIAEDYLTLNDYYAALTYPLYILFGKVNNKDFRGYDISSLFKEEETGSTISAGLNAIVIHHLFLRLKGIITPKLLIEWYENQIVDKAAISGFREAFPDAYTIGAQLFIHSANALNLFPSSYEIESNLTPHEIVTMGRFQCKMIEEYAGRMNCSIVSALRYCHIFEENVKTEEKSVKASIVVLLPQDIMYSVEILDVVARCASHLEPHILFLIKNHPTVSEQQIEKAFGKERWLPQFQFINDSLSNTLNKALFVISSNSSALIEALVRGVPVVSIVQQTQLYQDLLHDVDAPHAFKCNNSAELHEIIKRLDTIPDDERMRFVEAGKELRELYFTRLSENNLMPFLPREFKTS